MTFAEKVKNARVSLDMTQTQLGEQIGVSIRSILAYEKGQKKPRAKTMYKLAKSLGVSVKYLSDDSCDNPVEDIEKDSYIAEAREKYDGSGARDVEALLAENTALFAGGKLSQEQKDVFFEAVMKTYLMCKEEARRGYLDLSDRDDNILNAPEDYWLDKNIEVGLGGAPDYKTNINGVPHMRMKVPTGTGKTFTVCATLARIFDAMPQDKPKVVVWSVPSDSILKQTYHCLTKAEHPCHLKLNDDFDGAVEIYTKEMLLKGQSFASSALQSNLTICVLNYSTLRIDSRKKETRKEFQENENLREFARYYRDQSILLSDTPESALIQVLRHLSPVVIVDEGHNVGSDLNVKMLNKLNPSFVLSLTATARESSNIISYVDVCALKKNNSIKLPLIVYNRTSHQSVIRDAIQLRGSIEQQAIAEEQTGGDYIRPIVLFQAQPKIKEDGATFEKIKTLLIDRGIPKEQIAIKTSEVDELGDTDLLRRDCPIRYIITVNALKEGWDCPFVYILATLVNKTSKVDAEQVVGRVPHRPYARKHEAPLLNMSYILTCSIDFKTTVDSIVKGLNEAGISRQDFRVSKTQQMPEDSESSCPAQSTMGPIIDSEKETVAEHDDEDESIQGEFDDINLSKVHLGFGKAIEEKSYRHAGSIEALLYK